MARIERAIDEHNDNYTYYYLDLISFRDVSNAIASTFGIQHESPQALVIKDGACIYHTSHMAINLTDLEDQAS